MKVAVVGTGISGLSAAWLMTEACDLTVYEAANRVGGHSNTVDVDYDGVKIAVDTGFIVYNDFNYPNLVALLEHLKVPTELSDMSFAFSAMSGKLEWAGDNLRTIFAQKRNLFSPRFLRMLGEIMRFYRVAMPDLSRGMLKNKTLEDWLAIRGFSNGFRDNYLLPMGAAIWSTPAAEMLKFPAESFVRFYNNHRLLSLGRPEWRTVTGGSREYVERITAPYRDRIRLATPVRAVRRTENGVLVTDGRGETERYDHVVFACHSDQALAALADPDARERALLGAVRYGPNRTYLHRDESLMPKRRVVWSSWNYLCQAALRGSDTEGEERVSVSYWMNMLQNIDRRYPLFVSLNPLTPPAEDKTFAVFDYDHPMFDRAALEAQTRLDEIQGVHNTWFCGAWTGYGFHEDGLASGLDVAERITGVTRPWAHATAEEDAGLGLAAAE